MVWSESFPGLHPFYEIGFDSVIQSADELISPPAVAEFVSPGFIDIQVNGFAGVDYNDPDASLDQIAASLRTMFSTGVTRCFPTIITGSAERIEGALRNLTAVKRTLERKEGRKRPPLRGFMWKGHIFPRKKDREERIPVSL